MSRTLILIYGGISYFIGVAGLASIVAVLGRFMPFGYLWGEQTIALNPIVWNAILVILWGIIHSGMARPGFKAQLTKLIPEPAERATYILVSGLTSILLTGYWMLVLEPRRKPGGLWLACLVLVWLGFPARIELCDQPFRSVRSSPSLYELQEPAPSAADLCKASHVQIYPSSDPFGQPH